MHITFIQAGGTIDKYYPNNNVQHGYALEIDEPAVKSILESMAPLFTYNIVEAVKKDGTDLTEEDRAIIREAAEAATSDRVVITHGTSTLSKTAEALKDIKGKTIVLVGTMLPEKFSASDAKFNVGMAVGAVQNLPAGVYVALYGRVVPWQEFEKINEEYERKAGII